MKIRFPNLFPYGIIGWASQILATIGLVWPSSGCPRSHNCRRPYSRLRFYGSLDPKLYVPAILGPWVEGLFGTYSSYTRLTVETKSRQWPSLGFCHYHKRERLVADYDFMAVWTLYFLYWPYWVWGKRAIWYTQLIYPLLWNEKSRLLRLYYY